MLNFNEKKTAEKIGKIIGYFVAYFIFTTILFFILKFIGRLPENWGYFNVMAITLLIMIIGISIKRLLK